MNLMTLVARLLGRDRAAADVTDEAVRQMIRERQDRQEARLRALDLQANIPTPARRKR